jgi:thiamine-phosphate pyrophosphorylase
MIYALLDFDTLKKYDISIKDFLKTAKGLKAKFVQYRDKNSSIEEKKERIKEIKKYWKKTLIVNDNVELLDLADGIHIGQEDLLELIEKFNLSAYEVIEFLKRDNKIVGLSTHNKEEILKANSLPLSYIGLGAYRRTSTKDTTNILGEKIIDLIKFSYHPVAVIGGVKIYDKIPANFKVIGSDICKLTSIRLKKKKIFKMKLKSL